MKISFNISGTIKVSFAPPRPGPLTVTLVGELENNMIVFDVTLPPVGAADVVARRLSMLVNDGAIVDVPVAVDQVTVTHLLAPQDATVSLSLVDIDDAGNESAASTKTFVAADIVPPAQPGEIGVTITGEE